MDLYKGLNQFATALEKQKIPFAVIGGLAIFAYGGERATFDVDFLVHGDFKSEIKKIAEGLNLSVFADTSDVLQLSGATQIDIIFANRPLSQEMLLNTVKIPTLPFPVLQPEDLIGLKIQAFTNDRRREVIDKGDILTLMRLKTDLNFEKIKKYADIFDVWTEIQNLKNQI